MENDRILMKAFDSSVNQTLCKWEKMADDNRILSVDMDRDRCIHRHLYTEQMTVELLITRLHQRKWWKFKAAPLFDNIVQSRGLLVFSWSFPRLFRVWFYPFISFASLLTIHYSLCIIRCILYWLCTLSIRGGF